MWPAIEINHTIRKLITKNTQRDSKVRQVASTYPKDQNNKNMQTVMAESIEKAPKDIKIIIIIGEKGKGEKLLTHSLLIYYRLQERIPAIHTQFSVDWGILEKPWQQLGGLECSLLQLRGKASRQRLTKGKGQNQSTRRLKNQAIPQNKQGEEEACVRGQVYCWIPGIK